MVLTLNLEAQRKRSVTFKKYINLTLYKKFLILFKKTKLQGSILKKETESQDLIQVENFTQNLKQTRRLETFILTSKPLSLLRLLFIENKQNQNRSHKKVSDNFFQVPEQHLVLVSQF